VSTMGCLTAFMSDASIALVVEGMGSLDTPSLIWEVSVQ